MECFKKVSTVYYVFSWPTVTDHIILLDFNNMQIFNYIFIPLNIAAVRKIPKKYVLLLMVGGVKKQFADDMTMYLNGISECVQREQCGENASAKNGTHAACRRIPSAFGRKGEKLIL